jgi:uncharacterized protein YjiS (DUF1127 family)
MKNPSLHLAPEPRTSRALFKALCSWCEGLRERLRLRASLRALHALDDTTLRDLGLDRSEIGSVLGSAQPEERRQRVG